jgi:hypothetical protein
MLVALAGPVMMIAAGTVVLWPQPSRVTKANYDRIKIGMSRAEVEAIFGPPGDYTSGPVRSRSGMVIDYSDMEFVQRLERENLWWWATDDGSADISFDKGNQVIAMEFGTHAKEPQGAFSTLVWRAKRQWHRWFPGVVGHVGAQPAVGIDAGGAGLGGSGRNHRAIAPLSGAGDVGELQPD